MGEHTGVFSHISLSKRSFIIFTITFLILFHTLFLPAAAAPSAQTTGYPVTLNLYDDKYKTDSTNSRIKAPDDYLTDRISGVKLNKNGTPIIFAVLGTISQYNEESENPDKYDPIGYGISTFTQEYLKNDGSETVYLTFTSEPDGTGEALTYTPSDTTKLDLRLVNQTNDNEYPNDDVAITWKNWYWKDADNKHVTDKPPLGYLFGGSDAGAGSGKIDLYESKEVVYYIRVELGNKDLTANNPDELFVYTTITHESEENTYGIKDFTKYVSKETDPSMGNITLTYLMNEWYITNWVEGKLEFQENKNFLFIWQ